MGLFDCLGRQPRQIRTVKDLMFLQMVNAEPMNIWKQYNQEVFSYDNIFFFFAFRDGQFKGPSKNYIILV